MLLAAVAVTVMMVALAIAMRANDGAIDDHLGTATATVLSVSPLRTGIEFVDATGTTIRPEGGVLYPGLLSLGQQFVVEYSQQDPQIARVAGRTAAVGTLSIGLVVALTWLVAVPVIWWLIRRSRLPLFGTARGPGHASTAPSTNLPSNSPSTLPSTLPSNPPSTLPSNSPPRSADRSPERGQGQAMGSDPDRGGRTTGPTAR